MPDPPLGLTALFAGFPLASHFLLAEGVFVRELLSRTKVSEQLGRLCGVEHFALPYADTTTAHLNVRCCR